MQQAYILTIGGSIPPWRTKLKTERYKMTQDEIDSLERDFNAASSAIKKSVGGKPGEGAEKLYGQTYQQLVRAGLRTPLKRKYR